VPGGRSARGYEYIPGPGAYKIKNKEMGTDFPKCSIRNKIKNMMGKCFYYINCQIRALGVGKKNKLSWSRVLQATFN
jgi:hypothetical protein